MRAFLGFLLISLAALGADDAWKKVVDLKSGTEIRVYKKGARQPVTAKIDEANDERVVVVVKNQQMAIPKEEIDRIDYRPAATGKVHTETRTTTTTAEAQQPTTPTPHNATVPSNSSSSSVNFGGKPDFETLYRRSPGTK